MKKALQPWAHILRFHMTKSNGGKRRVQTRRKIGSPSDEQGLHRANDGGTVVAEGLQSCCPPPGWRRGVCHPEDFIEWIKRPMRSPPPVFLHLDDPAGRLDLDATLCQKPLELRLHPLVMGWEYRGGAAEQQKL